MCFLHLKYWIKCSVLAFDYFICEMVAVRVSHGALIKRETAQILRKMKAELVPVPWVGSELTVFLTKNSKGESQMVSLKIAYLTLLVTISASSKSLLVFLCLLLTLQN